MHYVVSDLHGCYDLWRKMLQKINLTDSDTLYVLGDVIDRGADGIELLLEMAEMPNVVPLWGNHELLALESLQEVCMSEEEKRAMNPRQKYILLQTYLCWQANGGLVTYQFFKKLPLVEQQRVLAYFEKFQKSLMLTINGQQYFLIHSVPEDCESLEMVEKVPILELLFGRPNYQKEYFPGITLVTGHTPTSLIPGAERGKIYRGCGHLALDCGAGWGVALGAICLETGEEFYVFPTRESNKP